MAKLTGPRCKLCRSSGMKLYLKGDRCLSEKCAIELRNYPPGPRRRRPKPTDYGIHLREKQIVRRMFGIGERQFKNYFVKAKRSRGVTGEELLRLLERRLDNVVYRAGIADSRSQARQLVVHRYFKVNGRVVDRPSFLVREGDVIEVKPEKKNTKFIEMRREKGFPQIPADFWLTLDENSLSITIKRMPRREEMEQNIDELLVVEYYSNRI